MDQQESQQPQFDEKGFDQLRAEMLEHDAKFRAIAGEAVTLSALELLYGSEEQSGVERRRSVAGALITLFQSMPGIRDAFADANPTLPEDTRLEMLQRFVESVFRLELGTMQIVPIVP